MLLSIIIYQPYNIIYLSMLNQTVIILGPHLFYKVFVIYNPKRILSAPDDPWKKRRDVLLISLVCKLPLHHQKKRICLLFESQPLFELLFLLYIDLISP